MVPWCSIYSSKRDNEEKSADLAYKSLTDLGNKNLAETVKNLVLCDKASNYPLNDNDSRLLADITFYFRQANARIWWIWKQDQKRV